MTTPTRTPPALPAAGGRRPRAVRLLAVRAIALVFALLALAAVAVVVAAAVLPGA